MSKYYIILGFMVWTLAVAASSSALVRHDSIQQKISEIEFIKKAEKSFLENIHDLRANNISTAKEETSVLQESSQGTPSVVKSNSGLVSVKKNTNSVPRRGGR